LASENLFFNIKDYFCPTFLTITSQNKKQMKKVIFGFVVLTLMFSTSCKKSSTPNSWSFKGTTYTQAGCVGSPGTLLAVSSGSSLTATFANGTLPTTGGTYTVVANPTTSSQIGLEILVTATTADYASTSGSVSVSVSGGKVSVSGSNVNMLNTNGSDSTTMNLNITQTQ
jgi:hypothetical protein